MHLAEICKWVRTEAGYAAHLRPISSTFSIFPRSWSGSRRRDSGPEAGGRQSVEDCGRNRVFCSQHLQVCNAYITGSPSPAVQATSRAQFMHTSHRTLHAGCKRGVGPWARCRGRGAPGFSNAWRPTRFAAGSSPRLAEVRRFSYIAHETRTGGRSCVQTTRYRLYDVYTARMQQDIAPVRVPTALATLQSHRHTQDAAETTRGGALQVCFTRHLRRHAQPMRCMRLIRTLCWPHSISCDKHATTEAEQELLASWTCRRSARS